MFERHVCIDLERIRLNRKILLRRCMYPLLSKWDEDQKHSVGMFFSVCVINV